MLISIPSVNKTYVQCVRKHKQNTKRTLTHPCGHSHLHSRLPSQNSGSSKVINKMIPKATSSSLIGNLEAFIQLVSGRVFLWWYSQSFHVTSLFSMHFMFSIHNLVINNKDEKNLYQQQLKPNQSMAICGHLYRCQAILWRCIQISPQSGYICKQQMSL